MNACPHCGAAGDMPCRGNCDGGYDNRPERWREAYANYMRAALQASEVFRRLRCFASAIEARRAAASDAVHESAVPQADAQVPQPAADLQPSQVDSHNHGPDNTSDRTDITGGSFES